MWNGIGVFISSFLTGLQIVFSTVFGAIANIVSSIWNGIRNTISSVANGISSVVSSVWNGIRSVTSSTFSAIGSVTSSIWNGIRSTISGIANGISGVVSGAWNAVRSITSSTWSGVVSTISGIFNGAIGIVTGIVNRIKGAFNFRLKFPDISIPHIPMPHFSLSGSFDPLKGKIPHVGIDWYAKGGLMTSPTMFGMNGNRPMVGGEAGDEAILPLNDKVFSSIAKGINGKMNTQEETSKDVTIMQNITMPATETPREFARTTRQQFQTVFDKA